MFKLPRVFAFLAVVPLFLGSTGRAQAQTTGTAVTVTVPTTGVMREKQDYAGKVLATQINYKDCVNNDKFTFTVNLGTNFVGNTLEVWAGSTCDMLPSRQANTATCWNVTSVVPSSINVTVTAYVRDMLYGLTGGRSVGGSSTSPSGGTGGTDSTDVGGASSGGTGGTGTTSTGGTSTGGTSSTAGSGSTSKSSNEVADCDPTSKAVGAQAITLYFLMLTPGASTANGSATWKGTYKLLAPDPPTGLVPGIGENIAPISWDPQTNQTDPTLDGYQFYCDPAPGQSGYDETGLPPPDPSVLPNSCTKSDILEAGKHVDGHYACGTAAKTATRGNATGLLNNVAYNVAVAATDSYRNVGVISTPACAIPQPVTGFFEAYRAAGGEGGGGFCSFSRHARPVFLFTVLGLGLCLVLRRRRAT